MPTLFSLFTLMFNLTTKAAFEQIFIKTDTSPYLSYLSNSTEA